MMNREIRRAQAKQDKKAEREKEERRAARKRKVEQLRGKRAERRAAVRARAKAGEGATTKADGGAASEEGGKKGGAAAAKTGAKRRGRAPGRFSGALMMATVFFIVLQSSVPPEESGNEVLRVVTGAGFYLLFGYFSVMWLMRRTVPRPLFMTWVTGAMLIVGVEVAKAIQGVIPFDPLMVALSLPAIVAGSYLGRLVYENTPA